MPDTLEVIAHVVQPVNWIQIVISIFSVVTSIVAIVIAIITYKSQVRHNKNSVKPILNIIVGDYEDRLYVKIVNNGVGPALIEETLCVNEKSKAKDACLIHLIPYQVEFSENSHTELVTLSPLTDFVEDIKGRTVAPGGSITLLKLSSVLSSMTKKRFALRTILKDVTVTIHYSDVYGDAYVTERTLDFFGRTLSNDDVQVIF